MSVQVLELECPGCQELLELDAGFAGGVCRCSSCGTLMTVPEDPSRQQAERLDRPSRPEAPGEAASTASTASTAAQRPADPVAAQTAAAPGSTPAPGIAPGGGGVQTFTTASGKTVRIKVGAAIPTARHRERRGLRAMIVGSFVAFLAIIVVGAVAAVWLILGGGTSGNDAAATEPEVRYDAQRDVFGMSVANVLGVPLNEKTVVVIDRSAAAAGWKEHVDAALASGLAPHAGKRLDVAVLAATAGKDGPAALSDGWSAPKAAKVEALLAQQAAKDQADLLAAAQKALTYSQVQRIVMVVAQRPPADQMKKIDDLMFEHRAVALDVIALDEADSFELEDLAASAKGKYYRVSSAQIAQQAGQH
jgi:hypothetical protein